MDSISSGSSVANHGFFVPCFDSLVMPNCNLGIMYGKKLDAPESKAAAALRSHCEAERHRRERINGHLATLRNLVPCNGNKLDKATLLAKVISQVKVLKKEALEATQGLLIPSYADEVIVEPYNTFDGDFFAFKASLCYDYAPELMSKIRQAIEKLKLKIVRAEISTLGSRVKSVFIIQGEVRVSNEDRGEGFCQVIRQSLWCVLDKVSASEEYSMFSNYKRRRVS